MRERSSSLTAKPKETLKKRAAFINAANGVFLARNGFVVQRNRQKPVAALDGTDARVGFTVTRKIGNAVVRNRIRRRLKEAIRHTDDGLFDADHDYVLIGRQPALTIDFNSLCADIEYALKKLARGEGRTSRPYKRRK
ncbi:MAG: ribonuclease P protein component [Pseudomonadota bacterium]